MAAQHADDVRPWPGFCQACKAPLSPPDRIDCPTCGASDYDEQRRYGGSVAPGEAPTGKLMRRADYVRVIRAILEHTHPAGNGGYVADIGPLTFGRMLKLAEVVVPLEGEHSDGDVCDV